MISHLILLFVQSNFTKIIIKHPIHFHTAGILPCLTSAGAMENWGCITYREVCMLVDPENATIQSKQYVATVIAHELAHQWFSDLVTMQWWDDLWLNESFANNMEYVCMDALEPSWNVWESFSISEANMALNRDATDGVQSVHVEVTHPDEIGTLLIQQSSMLKVHA